MFKFFGYEKNDKVCPLGCHYGIGDITPMTRAARAARMRDKTPALMSSEMIAFLNDWENRHGWVHYRMGVIGENTGTYNKNMKGQPLMGAIYIEPDLFNSRVDIHG
jgi:hypothetical protein